MRLITMQIIDQGIVAHSQAGTDRQSCAFPGVCVTSSGRWLVSFRAAPSKAGMGGQHPLICWSDDAGTTWSETGRPFQPPPSGATPGSFRTAYITALPDDTLIAALCWVDDTDPTRPFFNEETEGLLDTKICLSRSVDGGRHWSPCELVDTAPIDDPAPLTGPILNLGSGPEGDLLACQFELNKHYLDTTPWNHRSVLLLSRDGGRTWPEHVITSEVGDAGVFYWDQRPSVVGVGELVDLFWTFDRTTGDYLNIHARRSVNRGRDWSPLWDTGVPGQPAPAVRLADGRLVMVYVDRTAAPTIKVRTSDDDGHRWPAETERTLFAQRADRDLEHPGDMQTAWNEMYDFALGLPTTALLPGGDVLVVFYAGRSGDETDIHWQRLRF
jgi:hypothetical protein